jgi:CubicO group peptidase (beta-lactamase class C family)
MRVAERYEDAVLLNTPARPITLGDLLTHMSGLPTAPPPGLRELYALRNHTLAEAVMAFSQRPLEFEPGSRWVYCSPGIDTLMTAACAEAASGRRSPIGHGNARPAASASSRTLATRASCALAEKPRRVS